MKKMKIFSTNHIIILRIKIKKINILNSNITKLTRCIIQDFNCRKKKY